MLGVAATAAKKASQKAAAAPPVKQPKQPAPKDKKLVESQGSKAWRNKEKPLVLCARGITYRYRHLMTDLMQLMPHHKTDSKLDTKHDWNAINEVAELKVCSVPSCHACSRQKALQ